MEFPIRINKYLRDRGFASRREADELIISGKVQVNGKRAKLGLLINERDKVILSGKDKKECVYLAYYKPYGLATQGLKDQESVITQWRDKGIFPIGRLDKDSEGLLILTNDGRITSKILGEEEKYEKEYVVKVREKLRQGVPAIFERGMKTDIGDLLPAEAEIIDNHTLSIILHEGKRHQIRVMLGELGYTVSMLKRIRVGHIKLGKLSSGETRELTKKETDLFF